MGTNVTETFLHPPSFSGEPRSQEIEDTTHPANDVSDPSTRADQPSLPAQRVPTKRRSPLLLLFSRQDLLRRITSAKRINTVSIRTNNKLRQSMLTDHGTELRPVSLPVRHRNPAPPPPLPRSLPNLGWKRYSSYRIRHDPPPTRAPFPFPHSLPGSPSHLRLGPLPPDPYSHLSSSPM